jgi:hypothetical protein
VDHPVEPARRPAFGESRAAGLVAGGAAADPPAAVPAAAVEPARRVVA